MGLDVYLVSKTYQEWESTYNSPAWEIEDDDARKAALAVAKEMEPEAQRDVPSVTNPEHLCNRRYLRSSYNEAGFNSVVQQALGEPGFYAIFEEIITSDEGYEFELGPDDITKLRKAAEKARDIARRLDSRKFAVTTASGMFGPGDHMWSVPPTQEQVLEWFLKEEEPRFAEEKGPFAGSDYSNAKGAVFPKGLTIYAATIGKGFFGPEAMLVYAVPDEINLHYVQSALIAAEFCEEAIELIERDGSVYIHWSA